MLGRGLYYNIYEYNMNALVMYVVEVYMYSSMKRYIEKIRTGPFTILVIYGSRDPTGGSEIYVWICIAYPVI